MPKCQTGSEIRPNQIRWVAIRCIASRSAGRWRRTYHRPLPFDTLEWKKDKTLSIPTGFASYQGLPPTDGLSCTDCPNPTMTPPDTGRFEYQLVVSNAAGCFDTLTYRGVTCLPCNAQRLAVPNAFSPNGDRHNDIFRVVPYEGLEQVSQLEIFNR